MQSPRKPRNKDLNDVLVTRKGGKHKTDRRPSRAREKEIERRKDELETI
mgnify:CR=1 FL=1